MGESRRRKALDPNYGKYPTWQMLPSDNENYQAIKKAADEYFPGLSNVFLVQVDYPDSATYYGIVHIYIPPSGKLTAAPGIWIGMNNHLPNHQEKSGEELIKVVLKPLAQIVKDKFYEAEVVVMNELRG
jgi:hypothetical protein